MEPKIRYHYSYFIYPYRIDTKKYTKYLQELLNHKKCQIRFFQKEKDIGIYDYFLPNIRKSLFPTFEWGKSKIKKFNGMPKETQAAILAKYPCTVFDYQLEKQIQGKAGDDDGIFFEIQKIELVCFAEGICFLLLKTNIENTNNFSDLLDFNCKFREFQREEKGIQKYGNIKIQTNLFDNMTELGELVQSLTGKREDSSCFEMGEKFLTYSYACLDQENWNEERGFEELAHEFYKYTNILPSSYNINLEERQEESYFSKLKYIKMGFSKVGSCLLTSALDPYHYTKLPYAYENQYLYQYLFVLFCKIYFKQLANEYQQASKTREVRKKFIAFIQKFDIEEVTNDEIGSNLYRKWKKVMEINELYQKIKGKYDLLYKELNIEKTMTINKIIMGVLIILLIFNLILFFGLIGG